MNEKNRLVPSLWLSDTELCQLKICWNVRSHNIRPRSIFQRNTICNDFLPQNGYFFRCCPLKPGFHIVISTEDSAETMLYYTAALPQNRYFFRCCPLKPGFHIVSTGDKARQGCTTPRLYHINIPFNQIQIEKPFLSQANQLFFYQHISFRQQINFILEMIGKRKAKS